MKQTGFCKTPWALKEGAPRKILRPETAEERDALFKKKMQKLINSFGYPPKSCYLPDYETSKLKDGTVKLKKRTQAPKQIAFDYGDANEAWLLFWGSIPPPTTTNTRDSRN